MMEYFLSKMNRKVQLDEELVKTYLECDGRSELSEAPFIIAVKSAYKKFPSEEEVSEEELSLFCQNILISELKMYAEMPNIARFLQNRGADKLQGATEEGHCMEFLV